MTAPEDSPRPDRVLVIAGLLALGAGLLLGLSGWALDDYCRVDFVFGSSACPTRATDALLILFLACGAALPLSGLVLIVRLVMLGWRNRKGR